MSIVPIPVGRHETDRLAFRRSVADGVPHGIPMTSKVAAALQLVLRQTAAAAYCAACAAPIDFGAVWRGDEAYCSVECSLGGDRPA